MSSASQRLRRPPAAPNATDPPRDPARTHGHPYDHVPTRGRLDHREIRRQRGPRAPIVRQSAARRFAPRADRGRRRRRRPRRLDMSPDSSTACQTAATAARPAVRAGFGEREHEPEETTTSVAARA